MTHFRHLDLHPAVLIGQCGSGQIQGSVSLTNEDEENCTVLISGMHNFLRKWWDNVLARFDRGSKLIPGGKVVNFTKDLWTSGDAKVLPPIVVGSSDGLGCARNVLSTLRLLPKLNLGI